MKRTIKLSLVTAVAVTGLNSIVNAKPLEEAIKGIDISGKLQYRKEYKTKNDIKNIDKNEYELAVNVKTPINDKVSATVEAGFYEFNTGNTIAPGNGTNGVAIDEDPAVILSNAYFTYTSGTATVMAGKQNIPSVFVDQKDTVKTGAGLVALYTIDGTTFAAAHFTNTNIKGSDEAHTTELIIMDNYGAIKTSLNYNILDVLDYKSTRTSLNVDGKFGMFKAGLRVTGFSDDTKGSTEEDGGLVKLNVGAKFGTVSVGLDLAKTSEFNAKKIAIDEDSDAKVDLKTWQLSAAKLNDATVSRISVKAKIMPKLSVGVKYATASYTQSSVTDNKQTELLLLTTYKMSKNFSLHARTSTLTTTLSGKDSTDNVFNRLQAKYTF
ncbi:Major outer membrane protein [hydrothermal vent metagenome]|uniref:Major outer membrane protein n=1 Tax=hydrothermal vent metagenome TaxID=652676 RepID=A0A3B1E6G5_9ZZZZ